MVNALTGRHVELVGNFVIIPSPPPRAQELKDALGNRRGGFLEAGVCDR